MHAYARVPTPRSPLPGGRAGLPSQVRESAGLGRSTGAVGGAGRQTFVGPPLVVDSRGPRGRHASGHAAESAPLDSGCLQAMRQKRAYCALLGVAGGVHASSDLSVCLSWVAAEGRHRTADCV